MLCSVPVISRRLLIKSQELLWHYPTYDSAPHATVFEDAGRLRAHTQRLIRKT